MSADLSDAQVERFARDGFLSLRAVVDADEVTALQEVYDRLFDPATVTEPEDRVELAGGSVARLPQILNPDRYAPGLRTTPAVVAATGIAGRLLGEESELMGLHAIRKPANTGAVTPWHQDEAYWDPSFQHSAVSIWIPLQDVDTENGCLWFVPGSHRDDLREHELTLPGSAEGLQAVDQDLTGVACPLRSGGATVHAGRTLHSAGPNRTDGPRRALIAAFRTPPRWRGRRTLPWQPASWHPDR